MLCASCFAAAAQASNVWDVIPSDIVANVILATAAAVGQGHAAACIATPTRNGRVITEGTPCSGKEALAAAAFHQRAAAVMKQRGSGRMVTVSAFSSSVPEDAVADVSGGADQAAKGSDAKHTLLIVHCGSSTTYPLTIMESWNWGVEVYGESCCAVMTACEVHNVLLLAVPCRPMSSLLA